MYFTMVDLQILSEYILTEIKDCVGDNTNTPILSNAIFTCVKRRLIVHKVTSFKIGQIETIQLVANHRKIYEDTLYTHNSN